MAGKFANSLNPDDAKRFWGNYAAMNETLRDAIAKRLDIYGSRVGKDSEAYGDMVDCIDRLIYEGGIRLDTDIEAFFDPEKEWWNLQLIENIRQSLRKMRNECAGRPFNRVELLSMRRALSNYGRQFAEILVTDQHILTTLQIAKREVNVALCYS